MLTLELEDLGKITDFQIFLMSQTFLIKIDILFQV